MSNLLSQASLVMIPSGYKEDVVYSQIPTDGSGDLSFTRASNGTRVNSAGLVEVAPWNLVEDSETLNSWATNNSPTITANNLTAPNGTMTADTFQTSTNISGVYKVVTVVSGSAYTFSVYIKNISSANSLIIGCDSNPSNGNLVYNAITNTITSVGASITNSSVQDAGNGWYRVSGTYVSTGSLNAVIIYSGTSSSIQFGVWGVQLNIGSTAKPYFPTTDRLNVPRLTYQNGGGGCPSLLLEKQSTNLIAYSNANAGMAFNGTLTLNATTSPEGVSNGFSFLVNANANGGLSLITLITTAQSYTFSVYLKGSVNGQKVRLFGDLNGTIETFTLTTDWVRYTKTFTGAIGAQSIYLLNGAYISPSENDLYYGYGMQLEASSYATSLIPTNGSSATRVADLGANDVFGSTYTLDADFCLFQDFECFDFGNFPVFWSGGNYGTGGDYRSYMITYGTTDLLLYGINETLTARINSFTFSANTRYKVAVRRVGSTINWFINGTKYSNAAGTTTTTTVKIRSISGASLGGQNVMKLNEAIIFEDKTLTDADCISLTTL